MQGNLEMYYVKDSEALGNLGILWMIIFFKEGHPNISSPMSSYATLPFLLLRVWSVSPVLLSVQDCDYGVSESMRLMKSGPNEGYGFCLDLTPGNSCPTLRKLHCHLQEYLPTSPV